jgi:hypothetical protein
VKTEAIKVEDPNWKKIKKWFLKIVYILFVFFFIVDFVLFYIATPLLKTYLQNKVSEQTQGLFSLNFDKISIELASRRLALKKFELIPDTAVYNRLLGKGENIPALYKISCNSIELWKTSYYQLFAKSILKAKELKTVDLIIELQQLPDSITDGSVSRDFVHQDLFPSISKYVSELNIEEIKVINGKFNLDLSKNLAKKTTHYGYVSINLMEFRLNQDEHIKQDKLFFSENLLMNIDEYKINLSDNLHFIYAQDLTISTKDSKLTARNSGIAPRNKNLKFSETLENNYYKVHAPFIEIDNFDLFELYFNNDINIGNVSINKPKFTIFSPGKPERKNKTGTNNSKEIDLTQLITGKLNSIVVDTFKVNDGLLNFHLSSSDENPTYKADSLSLLLLNFRLDANSHHEESKILYADNIVLNLGNFSTLLPDKIHQLDVGQVHASTIEKKISIHRINLRPISSKTGIPISMKINIPSLEISGTNFYKLYHKREFNIGNLSLGNSDFDLNFENLAKPLQEKENQNNFFSIVLSNFIHHLSISNFIIKESNFKITNNTGDSISYRYQGLAAFALHKFEINNDIIENPKNTLFFSEQFNLKLRDYQQDMKDRVHKLFARTVEIVSADSLIDIAGLKIQKGADGQDTLLAYQSKLIYDLNLVQVSIKGIDINKAYTDSTLNARTISILYPEIVLEKNNYFRKNETSAQDSISAFILKKEKRKNNLLSLREGGIKGLLASFFPKIQVGILNLENAGITIFELDSARQKDLMAQARFSARFDGFKLTPEDSLHAALLVSENISFKLSDYFAKLFEKKYRLKIQEARFSSRDSVFFARVFRLFPDPVFDKSNQAKNLWTFYSSEISAKGTDIAELMNLNILNLGRIKIQNPSIISILNPKYTPEIALVPENNRNKPFPFDKIKIGGIHIDEGIFGIYNKAGTKENMLLNAHLNLQAMPFYMDSVLLANPAELIESLNAIAKLQNIRYLMPDSMSAIFIRQLNLNSGQKTIEADSISYFSFFQLLRSIRKPGLENVFVPRLVSDNFSFSKLLINKSLNASNLLIQSPKLQIINKQKTSSGQKFDIALPQLSEKIKTGLAKLISGI